jgi:hypothetical protein
MKTDNLLHATPTRWWSHTFSVMDGARPVAQAVDLSWWGDKGELRLPDATYTARYDKSSYLLESPAGVLARAKYARWWRRDLVIAYAGREYALRPRSISREFQLFEDATPIGSVSPAHCFSRTATVDLPQTLPLCLQVFIVWLVMTLWKHEEASGIAT